MISINFEDTYEPIEVAPDLGYMIFETQTADGPLRLKIEISPHSSPLLPNVFNLGFGPPNDDDTINDTAKVIHLDVNKAFSTILLFALTYLQTYPERTIGIDGSDDRRAYLYHRMFLTNRAYLSEYFIAIGVDWYVKLLRNGSIETDGGGLAYFKPKPEPFDYERPATNLYRYYMFKLTE